MDDLISNAEDCNHLRQYLKNELKNNIKFNTPLWLEILMGEYFFAKGGYKGFFRKGITFYIKYNKEEFLRLQVCTSYLNESRGKKLVVLNELYKSLSKKVGIPIIFYIVKDSNGEVLTLEWAFKEEITKSFTNASRFDEIEFEKLIFINQTIDKLDDLVTTYSKYTSLPPELTQLIEENMEEYLKYLKQVTIENIEMKGISKKLTK